MVGLPGQLFSNTPTPVTLWFINKNKKIDQSKFYLLMEENLVIDLQKN